MQQCSVISKRELKLAVLPIISKYVEYNEITYGEVSIKATIHSGKIAIISILDEDKTKLS